VLAHLAPADSVGIRLPSVVEKTSRPNHEDHAGTRQAYRSVVPRPRADLHQVVAPDVEAQAEVVLSDGLRQVVGVRERGSS
jgi:hypothetical protein